MGSLCSDVPKVVADSSDNEGPPRTRAVLSSAAPGSLHDLYDVGSKKLGDGMHGEVFRATLKATGEEHAIKSIPREAGCNIQAEKAALKAMQHPNTIRFFRAFEDECCVYLAMELCCGGDLYDHILAWAPVAETQAQAIMEQMFQSIRYVHNCNIAHRDIKPENFMFLEKSDGQDCGTLKLIDFGLSCACPPGAVLRSRVGTPYYVSPQVLFGSYDRQCDVWSAGVCMYLLLSGRLPFTGELHSEVIAAVKEGKWTLEGENWRLVSAAAQDLLHRVLQKNPALRATADQAVAHEWVKPKAEACPPAAEGELRRTFSDKDGVVSTTTSQSLYRQ